MPRGAVAPRGAGRRRLLLTGAAMPLPMAPVASLWFSTTIGWPTRIATGCTNENRRPGLAACRRFRATMT